MNPQRYGPFPYVPINRRPRITWPGGAAVALWVIPNIETFPLNEPVPGGTGHAPDIINWAPRNYGNRVCVFRVTEVLERHGVRGTVALNSEVCDDSPWGHQRFEAALARARKSRRVSSASRSASRRAR